MPINFCCRHDPGRRSTVLWERTLPEKAIPLSWSSTHPANSSAGAQSRGHDGTPFMLPGYRRKNRSVHKPLLRESQSVGNVQGRSRLDQRGGTV